eukprot:COSAG01_NODE_2415_length_7736_cov_42.301034_5_plen_85_part_00
MGARYVPVCGAFYWARGDKRSKGPGHPAWRCIPAGRRPRGGAACPVPACRRQAQARNRQVVVGTYLLRPGHSSKSFAAVLRQGA